MANEKNLKALEEAMKAAAGKYVQAVNDRESLKKQKELKKAASCAQDEYNQAVAEDTYRRWAEQGEPVKTAIRERTYRGKRVSFKFTDANLCYLEVNDTDLLVSLPDMERVIGVEHFANPQWFDMASNLAWIIASHVNAALGGGDDFAYEASEAAKNFEFPKGIDLKKDTTCIAALQQAFDAICWIPKASGGKTNLIKAEGPAWVYIRECMTKQAGRGIVAIGNTGKMSELIMDAMHLSLTSGGYSAREDGNR